ncbi:hypothetical protein QFZ65_003323 [Arthrobacter sp. B3I9]|nr:hypothetical protein [Arthrobacter sp. B3I9]
MPTRMNPKAAPGPGELLRPVLVVAVEPAPTMMFKRTPTTAETRAHHQHSLRLALPEKIVYILKNRLTATGNGARSMAPGHSRCAITSSR